MTAAAFDWQEAVAARARLQGVARHTPLLPVPDLGPGPAPYLKLESLQLTHAFKFRGAYNRVSVLGPDQRRAGLVTASSGNHGLGLSLAARMLGGKATVVMPLGAPRNKELGCLRYGATVIRAGQVYEDALAHALELAEQQDLTYVPSFDDPLIAAGQATVAWEILQDLPDVDVIVAPIGGGGLLAGIAGLLKCLPEDESRRLFPSRRRPLADILLVGVQAAGAASTVESARLGRRLELATIDTIADGIAVRQPGIWTFDVIHSAVDDYVTVEDEEMLRAVGLAATREKLVLEPAGAAALAAVLSGKQGRRVDLGATLAGGHKVVCIASGGNVEPGVLAEAVEQAAR